MSDRSRIEARGCPRCHADLLILEQSMNVAELAQPLGWVLVRRRCAEGCKLTAADFADH